MSTTKELGSLPRWDLSNVFPSLDSHELHSATKNFERRLRKLEKFVDSNKIGKKGAKISASKFRALLDEYLAQFNLLLSDYYSIRVYINSFVATDSFNKDARKKHSEFEPLGVRLQNINTRFSGWVGANAKQLPVALKKDGVARDHAFYLKTVAEQSRYMMSEAEESLAAELSLSGANAWNRLQGTIVSQLVVDFERDGKTEKISMPALLNIQHHDPDAEVRREAYEKEMATWETVKEPLAAALNGVKGATGILDKRRGRKDAMHTAIDGARIDRKTLDAMIGAMQDSFPTFRKYLRTKAKRLGHEGGLPWWDVFAPVGCNQRIYTWSETRDFILSRFGNFSPRLQALAKRAFDERWIDAEQRAGKRAGAFCTGVPAVGESRILCNFDGSLDQVSTVAHELGHAFHFECLKRNTMLNRDTPMTLAETASIFCETIIVDAALGAATDREEQLSILETDLIGKTQVIVDITSRYFFEEEVFNRRAKSELSSDDFCDIMLRAQAATYGDGLDERYRHKYMWTWKPHYYYANLSFYNFPYAFGLLFGTGLYAMSKQRGESFVSQYEELLSNTGLADAATLARRFSIDIRDKAFWKESLDVIGERVERYVAL